jgi:hypothetical protein
MAHPGSGSFGNSTLVFAEREEAVSNRHVAHSHERLAHRPRLRRDRLLRVNGSLVGGR